ncbi:ester cyclase [Echinicola jeungdonensis]|uniref:Ester cyclase n=1 Tax=Echinicola jeungdonensis TaxID=709343 RepID=A0ABV5J8K4_9BACT|nr:ester cyclase [Echinicola jeungdonensis]MDN3669397.1 ester cyclase [Echinicola jeungdonensis]
MKAKEIAKKWFESIDSKNFEGLKGLMAKNHSFQNPMTPSPIGRDEHIGMMQKMTSSFEGKHYLDQLIEEGNHVVVRGHWSGRHIGEFNGVPRTGNKVDFSWIDIFEIVDGKVAHEYFEMNPANIMAQIGALDQKKVS